MYPLSILQQRLPPQELLSHHNLCKKGPKTTLNLITEVITNIDCPSREYTTFISGKQEEIEHNTNQIYLVK